MTEDPVDEVEFDPLVALALAQAVAGPSPSPNLKARLLARIASDSAPSVPDGFSFRFADEADASDAAKWLPHPVPGIRMKVLALNRRVGYAMLLLDVAPGTRFPPHFHHGAEECFVISGSVFTCGRRMGAGDFLHADAGTDHGELVTEEGCQVLLVVPPEDYLPEP